MSYHKGLYTDGWAVSFSIDELDIFIVAAIAQLWRSAKEKKFRCKEDDKEDTLFRGWSGGSEGEGDREFELEKESSLVILELLSELVNATARAKALLLKLIVLLEIPPPLLLKG